LAKHRKLVLQHRMRVNVSVSCKRAKSDVRISYFDPAQLLQAPDVDVITMRQLAGFEQDHQIRVARKRFPNAGLTIEQGERIREGRRRGELVVWNEGSHFW